MRTARTPKEIEAGIRKDYKGQRGSRVVVFEPGDGTRTTLLLLPLDYLPGGVMRELDFPPYGTLVLWANPIRHPARKPSLVIGGSTKTISLRRIAHELGSTIDDAAVIAELLAYLFDLRLQGMPRTPESVGS